MMAPTATSETTTRTGPRPAAPRQRRSRQSFERILAATTTLLQVKDFAEITVADIAAEAGVSTGLLYSRFKTKEDLLPFILEQFVARQLAGARWLLSEERWHGVGLEARVEFIIDQMAEAQHRQRGLIRALAIRQLAERSDPSHAELAANRELLDLLANWLLAAIPQADAKALDASRFAAVLLSLVLQMMLLFERAEPYIPAEDMLANLKSAILSYLRPFGNAAALR